MIKFRNIFIICFALLLMCGFCVSCDDNYVSSIPNYPVSLKLNLISEYPNFRTPYQYEIFKNGILITDRVGYGGIIVCVSPNTDDGGNFLYYAYDMACPYEADQNVRVYPTDIGEAVCEKCGSVYDIIWGLGNPTSGPSKEVLKRYRTSISGDNLYIFR